MEEPERRQSRPTGLTRRNVLAIGGSVFGLAAAGSAGYAFGHTDETPAPTPPAADIVPFDSEHQAGIATPAQARLVFGAFDVVADRREDLRDLLRTWTDAARLMTAGQPAGPVAGNPVVPPQDTGEAEGLPPARLTVTIGLGPTLFGRDGHDRFGLAERRPAALVPLGPLPEDQLQPARCDGDVCVQACADDPQVAFHAVRNLLRIGRGAVELRWLQLGFGVNTSTTTHEATPRNLMGSRTARATSRSTSPPGSTSTCGSPTTNRSRGCAAAPISSHAASACSSRAGITTTSATRRG